ncbi:unnamed protein product [Brassicogethes aeneus]|uniref:VWFA domain-containing protein n=1 Tax=Brassicogethes aeneus TaxID=1431903 RepID=A0A9P0ASK7_BRAAE|nr:unnamed protein product [Brassicogethes aeneus]CAH0548683.1 unnamed protein product [Brassicogethes aeneus]
MSTCATSGKKASLAWLLLGAVLFLGCQVGSAQEEYKDTKQHPELSKLVRNWAQKLGGELWHFGDFVTRRSKVIDSYKDTNVMREDGEALLKDIHEKISEMMKQKVKAVERIMDVAENAAKHQKDDDVDVNHVYYNAKNLTNTVPEPGEEEVTKPPVSADAEELRSENLITNAEEKYQRMIAEENYGYQQDQDQDPISIEDTSKDEFPEVEIDLEVTDDTEKDPQASQTQPKDRTKLPLYRNRHFYNIPVNTNYSAVHVPSNVYDRAKNVISGIIWSEELDKTFRNNYKQDPTLSWQYFGSSTGFMRQFPAMIWSQEPIDLFDCRTRTWFIEAASSPKDIVILVDRSGSMTGMRREIARHVVHNILDTLGNNDYVNIYTFSNTTEPLVPCFEDQLVQANLANVRLFKESMTNFKTEQIANFTDSLITAFELLQDYRETKKGANCNQAIMLVTDGVQYNFKEIFEKYNWGNLPFMNVRVFTYLIGREVSDVREVKWMACANQGYYVHLSTYAEVREEVLQYIPVMARPMVLNANQKPNPTWSPVYADVTDPKLTNWLWVNRERNKQRERFMAYKKDKTLLSSVEQDKNYVHQQKFKQDNYGELQTYHLMTSVSLPVYDKKPRQERVANLLGVAGTDVPIEYIKRLMMSYRLGVNGYAFIVTNNGYILTHPDLRPVYQGILKPAYNRVDVTEVEVLDDDSEPREFSDEIRKLRKHIVMHDRGNATLRIKTHMDDMKRILTITRHFYYMGINATPFSLVIALPHKYGFNRVQHTVENDIHRMRSNDKSFTQFFTGNWTIHPDWHYCRYLNDHFFDSREEEFIHFLKKMAEPGWKWTAECSERKLICEVVGDAKITSWFSENITTTSKEDNATELIKRFGITVAFLATHSGLTRWQDFPQNIDTTVHEPNFHILHNKAIDETWYKRAVEHHYTDPRNFVYSVPFDIGDENFTLVTVSHAIFREDKDKSHKAPAGVVGYQFYHSALYSLFKNITFSCAPNLTCKRTCESEELHCLMLDDNGYIIISDNLKETGLFFGNVRPDILDQLVEEGIYKITTMFDYQGLCPEGQDTTNPATKLLSPLNILTHFLTHLWNVLYTMIAPTLTMATEDLYTLYHEHLQEKNKYIPCDEKFHGYKLVANFTNQVVKLFSDTLIYKIKDSNLLFVLFEDYYDYNVTNNIYIKSTNLVKIDYKEKLECLVSKRQFFKRNYAQCYNREETNVSEILLCHSDIAKSNFAVFITSLLIVFLLQY